VEGKQPKRTKIVYSTHIKERLTLRGIEYGLPRRIVEKAQERYLDNLTGHFIATMRAKLYEKIKDVMVAYVIEEEQCKLLTIHPLKKGQKENRINNGRWREIA